MVLIRRKVYTYTFEIITTKENLIFEAKAYKEGGLNDYIIDLLTIFTTPDKEGRNKVDALQQCSDRTKQQVAKFTDKYKGILPQLNGFNAFIRKFPNGEHFYFMPNLKYKPEAKITLHNHLKSLNEGLDFEELERNTNKIFGKLLKLYEVGAYGENKVNIGEPSKKKRVCRFCGKSSPEVTFKSKAHAISEALGNKTVVLFDECDSCNVFFSMELEPHIVQYLSLFRTMYNINAKGGSKKIKGGNFSLKKEEDIVLTLKDAVRSEKYIMPHNIKLDYHEKIILQSIYKILCKYFISVIDEKHLCYFEDTIKWIKGEKTIESLPRIAEMIDYNIFTLTPKLITNIRKGENKKFPYAIGELRFACKRFIYIIPGTNASELDFSVKKNYDHFWNALPNYKMIENAAFMDYSNNKARDFTVKLNINLATKDQN